jgi:hypothetical protein
MGLPIDATGREIDGLVYELYGLTEDEIAIVEGEAQWCVTSPSDMHKVLRPWL